jgi:glutamate/tyrosine decarboxylase-like PLP-dependent enzyme
VREFAGSWGDYERARDAARREHEAAYERYVAARGRFEALLRERRGWEVVSPAQLAIVCFRRTGHTDEQTDAMVEAMVAEGYAAPSTTVLYGRSVARLCTINPRTTEADIRETIERLERLDV